MNRLIFVLAVCGGILWVRPTPVSAQESDTAPEPAQVESPALPRQPGDDVAEPLENPVQQSDEAAAQSQAAYMAGVAAQKKGEFDEALRQFIRAAEADPTAAEPVRARALLLMRLGRIRQAQELARKAIQLDPDDFDTRLQLAIMVTASDSQNIAEAFRLVEEALQSKRLDEKSLDFIRIHRLRGRLYIAAADAARAAESYTVLLDALEQPEEYGLDFREHQALMKDRLTGYETIGKVMLEIGRYDKAITAFKSLIRVNNNVPGDHHYYLALAMYRRDDLEEAEQQLETYFESRRRTRESLQLLSDILQAQSRSSEVFDRLRALADDTNDADTVQLFLGDQLVDRGRADEAADVYQQVISDSANADAYLGLIRVDILRQDAASLLASVDRALRARIQRPELMPLIPRIVNDPLFGEKVVTEAVSALNDDTQEQNPSAVFFYSQIAEELELLEQEGRLLEATLALNPAPRLGIEAMNRFGLNQYAQDNYVTAGAAFRKLLTLPGLPEGDRLMTLYRLSAAEAENKNFDQAVAAIDLALKLRARNPQLLYQRGVILLRAERYPEAEETLQSAVPLSNSDPDLAMQTRMLLGGLYTRIGRWQDAVDVYRETLDLPNLTPDDVRRVRMSLSNAYVQMGDLKNGEEILELVYAETPDDPGVNNDLGYLYADQDKKLKQAEAMIRIAVDAEPDNPAYLDSLGWVLYRLERYEEALDALTKATADPEYQDSTIIDHRGDVQQALGKKAEAKASWEEALKIETESAAPNDDLIKRIREKLSELSSAEPEEAEPAVN